MSSLIVLPFSFCFFLFNMMVSLLILYSIFQELYYHNMLSHRGRSVWDNYLHRHKPSFSTCREKVKEFIVNFSPSFDFLLWYIPSIHLYPRKNPSLWCPVIPNLLVFLTQQTSPQGYCLGSQRWKRVKMINFIIPVKKLRRHGIPHGSNMNRQCHGIESYHLEGITTSRFFWSIQRLG